MSLKDYQTQALQRYEDFLRAWLVAQETTPGTRHASRDAFERSTLAHFGFRVPDHAPSALGDADVPMVCLHIPTGGKTLIGGPAIDEVKRVLLPGAIRAALSNP